MIDQLTFDLGCKINIDKTEREKFFELYRDLKTCVETVSPAEEIQRVYRKVVQMNRIYLTAVVFDASDEDEQFVKRNLEDSILEGRSIHDVFMSTMDAYTTIIRLIGED